MFISGFPAHHFFIDGLRPLLLANSAFSLAACRMALQNLSEWSPADRKLNGKLLALHLILTVCAPVVTIASTTA